MVAVVLAAGSGSRFGATKQLADLGGRTLLEHAVSTARDAAAVDGVHVVVGHDADEVAAAARATGPVTVVANPDHALGQATSLRSGIRSAVDVGAEVVVILLADEPDASLAAVDAVIRAVCSGAPAARARYDDGVGHPVAFGSTTFAQLATVTGDRGARDLLVTLGVVEVAVAGPRPRDVDRPEDLTDRARR